MKVESQIRWKQGDYIKLGKAVSNFNKKINELNKLDQKIYLPENKNYKEIKQGIKTRAEFNRVLKSIRDFSKEGAEDLYVTQAGEEITKWENRELNKQIKIANKRLTEELKTFDVPYKSGYTKAQMGSLAYQEILAQIRSLQKLEYTKGYSFKRLKDRIQEIGKLDYKMMKATIYRENFMEALKSAENFENYDKLIKKLNRIKNPINFFNFIQKSDVLSDIFLYYKEGSGIIYGSFASDEDRFNYGLEELEIL